MNKILPNWLIPCASRPPPQRPTLSTIWNYVTTPLGHLNYGSYAQHMTATSGFILVEAILALGIFAIALPGIITHTLPLVKRMTPIIFNQQLMVERLDLHITLLHDTRLMVTPHQNCCFDTAKHTICYSVINNTVRRKKKRIQNTQFYQHTIGKHAVVQSLSCRVENQRFHVDYIQNNRHYEWTFEVFYNNI
jgi:hypothetical protein